MTDEQTPDDVREAVAHAEFLRQYAESHRMDMDAPDLAMRLDEIADLLAALSTARRPTVSAEQVWAIADGLRKRLSVSNGTQVWVEYQGSAEELADMIAEIVKEE